MSEEKEVWLPVVGWEGMYEVSSLGAVRSGDRLVVYRTKHGSHTRIKKGQLLRPGRINSGYLSAHLYRDGVRKPELVHRLVACAFIPDPQAEVNHKDFNQLNNRVDNLEWCSHLENVEHSAPNKAQFGYAVTAKSSSGDVRGYRSQAEAEKALLGKMTGIVSWAIKHGKPALGYEWSRV